MRLSGIRDRLRSELGLEVLNHNLSIEQKKGLAQTANPLVALVPEARIELARYKVPLDFESSASTSFTTPAHPACWDYREKEISVSI